MKEGQAEPVFMNKNEIQVFKNPLISAEVVFTDILLILINFLSHDKADSFQHVLTSG